MNREGAKSAKDGKFTVEELEFLRLEAEKELAAMKRSGLRGYNLAEKMHEFAIDYNRDNVWNTPRALRFGQSIRRHLKKAMNDGVIHLHDDGVVCPRRIR